MLFVNMWFYPDMLFVNMWFYENNGIDINGDFVGLLFRKGPNDGHYGSASGQVGLYENTCLLVY